MNILGLSTFADASVAIINSGRIVCAVEEERLNRIKHYYGMPFLSIKECLKLADMTIDDINLITVGWNPYIGWYTRVSETLKSMIISREVIKKKFDIGGNYISDCLGLLNLRSLLSKQFPRNRIRQKIEYVGHHLAHAASTFYPSPFSEANIIIADGVGEAATVSLFYGKDKEIKKVHQFNFPHSLGHVYAAVTGFLGFRMTSDEGKVMALAGYGRDNFKELFDRLIVYDRNSRTLKIDMHLLDYHGAKSGYFSKEWLKLTGLKPRKKKEKLTPVHEDLAHSLQQKNRKDHIVNSRYIFF
jgi:carbamoyltransferase